MVTIGQLLQVVEIRTKVISLGTTLCGMLFSYVHTGLFAPLRSILFLIAVLCIDMGTTGFNSYFDYRNGTDTGGLNQEKDKLLVHQGFSPKTALWFSIVLYLIAALLGILLALATSLNLLVVGAVCMGAGVLYTAGPLPISRTPLGEGTAGLFLGSVLFVLSSYINTVTVEPVTLLASLPSFFLVALILGINNLCDRQADKKSGRRTLVLVIGVPAFKLFVLLLFLAAWSVSFLLYLLTTYFSIYPLIFSLIVTTREFGVLFLQGFDLKTKSSSMRRIVGIYGIYCLSYLVSLILI